MKSSHKLKFKRNKYIHSIERPLISIDLKFGKNQIKLRPKISLIPNIELSGEKVCRPVSILLLHLYMPANALNGQ